MADGFRPIRGTIVTFLNSGPDDTGVFLRAVALDGVRDPENGELWVVGLRPDGRRVLIASSSIVDTTPWSVPLEERPGP